MTTHTLGSPDTSEVRPPESANDGCSQCVGDPTEQPVIRQLRDGAFDRIDHACGVCETEYPIWYERAETAA